jgi:hypothetical protein
MSYLKKTSIGLLGAAVTASALALAVPASAYVVCNRSGECWHAHDRHDYPATAGVVIHDDGWVFDRPGYYKWAHDHVGRGYWVNGHWHRF